MRASILFRLGEFYAALAIMGMSGWAAFVSFSHTRAESQRAAVVERPLKVGREEYAVLSHGACVGRLQTELERLEGEINLSLRGDLLTELGAKSTLLRLEGDLSFNMLGQLGGGLLKLSSPEFRFAVGLEDINPIRVSLISGLLGEGGRRLIQIPGPLELTRVAKEAYQMRYLPLAQHQAAAQGLLSPFAASMDLKVIPRSEARDGCGSMEQELASSLKLDPVAEIFRQQVQLFGRLVPSELLKGPGGLQ